MAGFDIRAAENLRAAVARRATAMDRPRRFDLRLDSNCVPSRGHGDDAQEQFNCATSWPRGQGRESRSIRRHEICGEVLSGVPVREVNWHFIPYLVHTIKAKPPRFMQARRLTLTRR